jgi:hypothetical protein
MSAFLEPLHARLSSAVRRGESVFVPQEATHVVGIEAISLDVAQRRVAGKAERLLAMVTKQGGGVKKRNQCIWVAIAILVAAVWTNTAMAGFVDGRTAPGSSELDVTYKAVPVEDLALGIVPASYRVEYDRPELKKQKVTVVAKGTWDGLLNKALKEAGLQSTIDESKRVVMIKPIPVVKADIDVTGKSGAAVASPTLPAKPACVWDVVPSQSYETTLNRWVKCAGWAGVDWRGKEMVPSFPGRFQGGFVDAVRQLKQATGLDISLFEDNKVVVVVVPR